jgi:uncharacterized OB-fold protein
MDATSDAVVPVEADTDVDSFFWDACANRVFWLQHCCACSRWQYYPRNLCVHCWSTDIEWRRPSGRATVESFSRVERGSGAFAAIAPYVVALVRLEEGPIMMSNVVAAPDDLAIGAALVLEFADRHDRVVPVFRVAGTS